MRTMTCHVTRAWILLVLLTLLSMAASHSIAGGIAGSGLVLTAAVAKGRWMVMDFLKLRHVPSGWRLLLSSWLVLIAASAWLAATIPLLRG
ncbi:hypothetical protein DC522_31565 [Microvirga sp. KLBC 81]|uniref:cytochrome C oxidase subunit IV family protein n=1 Tax=Microvirga sp. KLBC 81 TaxID=1862707 RepID=UPI000D506028|nr:cytochrome C oxidase subunit IV family protein [Microvirga sp. KLBC 81]PVE20562.1 hypothetical protein DC522_31565 [Microvirga sp. KLBC 81]